MLTSLLSKRSIVARTSIYDIMVSTYQLEFYMTIAESIFCLIPSESIALANRI
jgi:hypothetical protein